MSKFANIADIFWEQKDRWILWVPVFIAIGIGCYFSLKFEPKLGLPQAIIVMSLVKIYVDYKKARNYLLFIPIFLIALGFSAAQFRTSYMYSPMLQRQTRAMTIEATVASIEALPKGEHRVLLSDIEYQYNTQKNMPAKVRIKLKKGRHYAPYVGERIKLRAVLIPLASPSLPNSFDFQRFAYFKGFYATGYVISDAEVISDKKEGVNIFPAIRRYLRERIKQSVTDADISSIIIALITGERRDISEQKMEVIRKAGIAHLMAISGLHMALVTGFFFFLIRYALNLSSRLTLHLPIKKISACIAMFGAIFYMLLIGDAVSAERAAIMISIFMLAIMLDRDPFTLRVAAFAATLMLLYQPEILFGASFQLSFSAVISLIAFYEATKDKWSTLYKHNKYYMILPRGLLAIIATTIVATLAVLPFSLFHFLRASTFTGLVANIVAVPVASFITIPFAIVASLLMPFGLEKYLLQISALSVEIILKVAYAVEGWQGGMIYTNQWSIWLLVIISFGGLWLCIWQGKLRLLGLVPILIAFTLIPLTPRADILIADKASLFAVRDSEGNLWFSEKRRERFTRDKWQESEGSKIHGFWGNEDSPVKCDENICTYKYDDKLVSFVKDASAIELSCLNSDIIISRLKIDKKNCYNPKIIIDRNDSLYNNAHIIYKDIFANIKVKNTRDVRGSRPWIPFYRVGED